MATRTIAITLRQAGDSAIVEVAEPKVQGRRNRDNLRWTCSGGEAFAILFGGASPFGNQNAFSAKVGKSISSPVIKSSSGTYKYSIAIAYDTRIATLDPEVVVDEGPPLGPPTQERGRKVAVGKAKKKAPAAKKRAVRKK